MPVVQATDAYFLETGTEAVSPLSWRGHHTYQKNEVREY